MILLLLLMMMMMLVLIVFRRVNLRAAALPLAGINDGGWDRIGNVSNRAPHYLIILYRVLIEFGIIVIPLGNFGLRFEQ